MWYRGIEYAYLATQPQLPREKGGLRISHVLNDEPQQFLWQVDKHYFKCWTATEDRISTGSRPSIDRIWSTLLRTLMARVETF